MTPEHIAFMMAVIGMLVAMVCGYLWGFADAEKQYKNESEDR